MLFDAHPRFPINPRKPSPSLSYPVLPPTYRNSMPFLSSLRVALDAIVSLALECIVLFGTLLSLFGFMLFVAHLLFGV